MLRKLLTLITLFILGGASLQVRASHISGGEIYWECVGPNQFVLTMVLYRDCEGIPMSLTETIQANSPCGSQSVTLTCPGGTEISQLMQWRNAARDRGVRVHQPGDHTSPVRLVDLRLVHLLPQRGHRQPGEP
jgi:hypothetical protein